MDMSIVRLSDKIAKRVEIVDQILRETYFIRT